MKIAVLTTIISPHLVPFCRELAARVGRDNVTYIHTEPAPDERVQMGWRCDCSGLTTRQGDENDPALMEADVVYLGLRVTALAERRNRAGKTTVYAQEHWFGPPYGLFRLLSPRYFAMAKRFVRLFSSPHFSMMPQGVHAVRDMLRLVRLFHGDLRCLFRAPKVAFESRPGGIVVPLEQAVSAGVLSSADQAFARRHGFVQIPPHHWNLLMSTGSFAKIRIWGYFVPPSTIQPQPPRPDSVPSAPRSVLWAGRLLDWKRVDVLVRAVRRCPTVTLDVYGHGPAERRLHRLAKGCAAIRFHDFVPIEAVRDLMRRHDLYVLPSDGCEGWGAVVNEALEEDVPVIGSIDAGACATVLPPSNLFSIRRPARLVHLLRNGAPFVSIGPWTISSAVTAFLKEVGYAR